MGAVSWRPYMPRQCVWQALRARQRRDEIRKHPQRETKRRQVDARQSAKGSQQEAHKRREKKNRCDHAKVSRAVVSAALLSEGEAQDKRRDDAPSRQRENLDRAARYRARSLLELIGLVHLFLNRLSISLVASFSEAVM